MVYYFNKLKKSLKLKLRSIGKVSILEFILIAKGMDKVLCFITTEEYMKEIGRQILNMVKAFKYFKTMPTFKEIMLMVNQKV